MATVEEKLRLVVEATTGSASTEFGKLTTAAERSATASNSTADAVRAAADAVAQARAKEADATGKLSVAQARLDDLRAKGKATTAQLVAAEEGVAAAQRRVQIASSDTTRALAQQDVVQEDVAESAGRAEGGTDRFGEGVGRLRNQVAGLVAGVSLADWVGDSVRGYLDGARGASSLAQAMNATTEEAGQLNTLMGALGLEMDDLLEIQAEFAQKVAADDEALSSFGATLQTNSDGTTNWAGTLTNALAALQKIPDATRRNEIGFKMFGEEGYKQLSRLLLSGRSVEEALEQIGTPFTDDDVEAARRYDAAMLELSSTGGNLARTLGGTLVPILTEVLGAIGDTVGVISEIPAPIGIAIALTIAYATANKLASDSGGILAATQGVLTGGWTRMTGAVAGATVGTGAFAATAGVARAAGAGLLTVLGGPVGLAILGLGAGFTILNSVMGDNESRAEGVAKAQETLTSALQESNGVITQSVRQAAALAAQESGLLDAAEAAGVSRGDVTDALLGNEAALKRVRTAIEQNREANKEWDTSTGTAVQHLNDEGLAADNALESLDDLLGSTRENAEGQTQLANELGQTTDKTALAEAAMQALTAIIDAGTTGGTKFADAVKAAAEAQDAQEASSNRAEAAIDAYRATTSEAVDATLELVSARYASENATFAFLTALDDARSATDDSTTSVNEHREAQVKLMEAALASAEAVADTAVQNAEATGQVVDDVAEAQIRADAMLGDLRSKLNTPGLTKGAREELQGIVDQLQAAKDRGDIEAVLTLTGAPETAAELDETTEDRDTTIEVETRGGPAVVAYLGSIARAERLAIIRVESRGGPAVREYLDGLRNRDRLAIIRVESRGGPAVDDYLDGLARERLAIIRVETRGGPSVQRYLDELARDREVAFGARGAAMSGAPNLAAVGAGSPDVRLGSITLDLELTGRADRGELGKAERGRARVEEIKAYEKISGPGWRRR